MEERLRELRRGWGWPVDCAWEVTDGSDWEGTSAGLGPSYLVVRVVLNARVVDGRWCPC